MNSPQTPPEEAPGHYGAGYGEQVPDAAPPQPAPKTDANATPTAPADTARTQPVSADTPARASNTVDTGSPAGTTSQGDDGNPVVFTPDDVGARPPDHPPTERAPESEKAGLIFERS